MGKFRQSCRHVWVNSVESCRHVSKIRILNSEKSEHRPNLAIFAHFHRVLPDKVASVHDGWCGVKARLEIRLLSSQKAHGGAPKAGKNPKSRRTVRGDGSPKSSRGESATRKINSVRDGRACAALRSYQRGVRGPVTYRTGREVKSDVAARGCA